MLRRKAVNFSIKYEAIVDLFDAFLYFVDIFQGCTFRYTVATPLIYSKSVYSPSVMPGNPAMD